MVARRYSMAKSMVDFKNTLFQTFSDPFNLWRFLDGRSAAFVPLSLVQTKAPKGRPTNSCRPGRWTFQNSSDWRNILRSPKAPPILPLRQPGFQSELGRSDNGQRQLECKLSFGVFKIFEVSAVMLFVQHAGSSVKDQFVDAIFLDTGEAKAASLAKPTDLGRLQQC